MMPPMSRRAATDPARTELRSLRMRNRVLREQLVGRRLERAAKLQESQAYWVEPYVELLSRLRQRDWAYHGPSTRYDRRYGADRPIYQNEQELALLRAPGRILLGVNGYAQGLARGLAGYVFGKKSDIRFTSDDQAVQKAGQKAVEAFLTRNHWHGGLQPSLERELWVRRGLPDGEWLLTHHPQPDGHMDVRVQDPEQLTMPPGADYREWSYGVYADPDDPCCALAYWIMLGDVPEDGLEYDASRVTHCRRNVTRSMKRGIPDFAFDTYEQFIQAGQLTGKLGASATLQAAVAGYRKHTSATVDQVQSFIDEQADYQEYDTVTHTLDGIQRYKEGRFEDFGDNTEYVPGPSAANGNVHLAILAGVLRAAAARFNAPEWMVAGATGNNDYATALSAGSQFTRSIWDEQGQLAPLFARSAEMALEHWVRTNGLEVLTEDGRGVARTLTWDQVKRLGQVVCEFPSPEFTDKLQNTQRRSIMNQAGVLSPQTWQQEEGLDPEKESDNIAEWQESHPQMGNPLSVPDDFGVPGTGPRLGESLRECGGEGGKPGPCKTGDDAGDDKPSLARRAWSKVKASVVSQYHELADFYGKPAALAIVATAALPIPGSSAVPIAAKLLARGVKHVRARQAALAMAAHESQQPPPDLDGMVRAVKRVVARACEITGEDVPEFDDDAIRKALAARLGKAKP